MVDVDEIRDLAERLLEQGEKLPSGLSQEALAALEERVGLRFPKVLREWLYFTNGAPLPPGGFFGIRPGTGFRDYESFFDRHPDWKTKGWIPVAGDGSGNYYVLWTAPDNRCPIFFLDMHEDPERPTYVVASELWLFVRSLLRKELMGSAWQFDRAEVLREDPDILAFPELTKPWEESGMSAN